MLKKKISLPLVWLMCVSFASGYLTVICHGSDGQMILKPAMHNPCECPSRNETDTRGQEAAAGIVFVADHEHCTDSGLVSLLRYPERKNDESLPLQLCIPAQAARPLLINLPSFFSNWVTLSSTVLPFHEPLKTVILLT